MKLTEQFGLAGKSTGNARRVFPRAMTPHQVTARSDELRQGRADCRRGCRPVLRSAVRDCAGCPAHVPGRSCRAEEEADDNAGHRRRRADEARPLLPVVRMLGQRHAGYGVTAEHFAPVGAALIWTLEKGLGEAFTPDVKAAWVEVYGVLSPDHDRRHGAAAEGGVTAYDSGVPLTPTEPEQISILHADAGAGDLRAQPARRRVSLRVDSARRRIVLTAPMRMARATAWALPRRRPAGSLPG